MSRLPLVLRRAETADFEAIHGLLREASRWLKTKGTDQWAAPWPDENGRNERIQNAIKAGRTWIALAAYDRAAATLTTSPNHNGIWPEAAERESAVYIRRPTVSREYAGLGLGAQLLDWAGLRASHEYGGRWIRVDVWTTNTRLHEYYRDQGFRFFGYSPVPGYPSAALFQKAVDEIKPIVAPLFHEATGNG